MHVLRMPPSPTSGSERVRVNSQSEAPATMVKLVHATEPASEAAIRSGGCFVGTPDREDHRNCLRSHNVVWFQVVGVEQRACCPGHGLGELVLDRVQLQAISQRWHLCLLRTTSSRHTFQTLVLIPARHPLIKHQRLARKNPSVPLERLGLTFATSGLLHYVLDVLGNYWDQVKRGGAGSQAHVHVGVLSDRIWASPEAARADLRARNPWIAANRPVERLLLASQPPPAQGEAGNSSSRGFRGVSRNSRPRPPPEAPREPAASGGANAGRNYRVGRFRELFDEPLPHLAYGFDGFDYY